MERSLRGVVFEILTWYHAHPRAMPWKETQDPYRIWLSEIMLQQTQVAQGLQYYARFLTRFPDVHALADAPLDEVLRYWQGLGYNSRARNLHETAREIVTRYHGCFPETYAEILALKGIGAYTAAAIGSFAFGLRTPVLDTNVIRVLSRVFGLAEDFSKPAPRRKLYDILDKMIDDVDPADFNQAIMNFGAAQCTPRNPDCASCGLQQTCRAYADGTVDLLPVRPAKKVRRDRYFHYLVLMDQDGLIIRRRVGRDIWEQMFEFPLIETQSARHPGKHRIQETLEAFGIRQLPARYERHQMRQILTHQQIHCSFYVLEFGKVRRTRLPEGARFEFFENLEKFAFPKVIREFLNDREGRK